MLQEKDIHQVLLDQARAVTCMMDHGGRSLGTQPTFFLFFFLIWSKSNLFIWALIFYYSGLLGKSE